MWYVLPEKEKNNKTKNQRKEIPSATRQSFSSSFLTGRNMLHSTLSLFQVVRAPSTIALSSRPAIAGERERDKSSSRAHKFVSSISGMKVSHQTDGGERPARLFMIDSYMFLSFSFLVLFFSFFLFFSTDPKMERYLSLNIFQNRVTIMRWESFWSHHETYKFITHHQQSEFETHQRITYR